MKFPVVNGKVLGKGDVSSREFNGVERMITSLRMLREDSYFSSNRSLILRDGYLTILQNLRRTIVFGT